MDKRAEQKVYEFDDFRLDAEHLILWRNGKEIGLAPKAVETLLALVRCGGEVVSKDELLTAVWPDAIVEESNLFAYLSHLRKALGNRGDGKPYLETLRRRGYRFHGDIGSAAKPAVPFEMVSPDTVRKPIKVRPVRLSSNSGKVVILADWPDEESNTEAAGDLKAVVKGARSTPVPFSKSKRRSFVAAALALLLLGSLGFFLSRTGTRSAATRIQSIAILPFRPLVSETRNEPMELGMANTLINKLSASGEIEVRPLSSVRRFSGLEEDALSIGRKLGVDSVLESSIQTADDRIQVSVRLINTADGSQIWAEQFNEPFKGIFDVQNSISEKVAVALRPQLSAAARTRLAKNGTRNPEAYRLYLQGQYHVSRVVLPETQKGISFLEQALALDPNYALAYAEISNAYRTQALGGNLLASDVLPKSKDAALRSLAIDETLAEAYIAAGHAAMLYDRDWGEAERHANRALELEPGSAAAMYLLENLYSFLGRHDEAIAFGRKARELAPLTLIYNSIEAQTLLYAGRVDEALERAMKARELDDNFWHVHLILARIYIQKEMYREAIAEADRAAQLSGDHSYDLAVKGYALAKSGAAAEARNIMEELLKRPKNGRYHTHVAIVYTGLGDHEKALEHLEKGFEKLELQHELKSGPGWSALHSEPRFIELMKRMNFEQ